MSPTATIRTRHLRALALALGLLATAHAEAKNFVEVEGVVVMEAESASELRGFKPRTDGMGAAEPSAGLALEDAGGSLRFDIKFTHPGRYYLWCRMAKPISGYASDKANDCTVRFNGQPLHTSDGTKTWTVIGMGTHNKSLTWQSRPKSHDAAARDWHVYLEVPEPGIHKLEIVSRSPGFLIDKLALIHAQKGGDALGGGKGTADRAPDILKGLGPAETGVAKRRKR